MSKGLRCIEVDIGHRFVDTTRLRGNADDNAPVVSRWRDVSCRMIGGRRSVLIGSNRLNVRLGQAKDRYAEQKDEYAPPESPRNE